MQNKNIQEIHTIGIPRAMHYYRFQKLWETFFKELGYEVILSPQTDKEILAQGSHYAIDESCLSGKIYLGHVAALIGKCDAIFIQRFGGLSYTEETCPRFEALYDTVANTFYEQEVTFLHSNVDLRKKGTQKEAYMELGKSLGRSKKEIERAYEAGIKAEQIWMREKQQHFEKVLNTPGNHILLAGHDYILNDTYIGKQVQKLLKDLDVQVLLSDEVDREEAVRKSYEFSKGIPWLISREMIGAMLMNLDRIDGIIQLSAFPCGPDSMGTDIVSRKIKQVPVITLSVDAQSALTGMETRLESFVDIIRFKQEGGYAK